MLFPKDSTDQRPSAWEQRKLGDIAREITRIAPKSTAPVMMITASEGFIEQSERYAFNNAGQSLKKYILLRKGELAYNHGASKLRPFGSCFSLSTSDEARVPFVYHCFEIPDQHSDFVSIELNGENIEGQLRKLVSSGARMDGLLNISYEDYETVEVRLPSGDEQRVIARLFSDLDSLITLHQRKEKLASRFYRDLTLRAVTQKHPEKESPSNTARDPDSPYPGTLHAVP